MFILYTPFVTLLCVPIMVQDADSALAEARQAALAGADLIEFRLDELFHGAGDLEGIAAAVRLVDESPLACIVTCRVQAEGGAYDGDEADRVALFERLGGGSGGHKAPRYVDIEWSSYQRSANFRQKVSLALGGEASGDGAESSLILSAHDFNARPTNLSRVISDMDGASAGRINKIAWRARSLRDNIEAFEVLMHRSKPTIALCMGEFGLLSRVLAPKFGGFLTFASLRDTSTTAPGQPTTAELLGLYRFRSITRSTRVFGVIGWPVEQSRSPHVHNAGFESVGFDGVYLPLPVPPEWEHFKATLHALLDFKPLDFRGASVTIPHKEHLLRFAREDSGRSWRIDPLAERCGAANTLVVDDDGTCRVMNTDARAASGTLRKHFGGDLTGKRVVILGGGGVARAVAGGVIDAGGIACIRARRREQSEQLARELAATGAVQGRLAVQDWGSAGLRDAAAIVNCTPIGMTGRPESGQSPLTTEDLREVSRDALVFDTVYNPIETPLLALSRETGLNTADGAAMFVDQASAQFEAWTGVEAPKSLFRRVLLETLFTKGS